MTLYCQRPPRIVSYDESTNPASAKKCGVMLVGLSGKTELPVTLFDDDRAREKSARTMQVTDRINKVWGSGTIRSAAIGIEQPWKM